MCTSRNVEDAALVACDVADEPLKGVRALQCVMQHRCIISILLLLLLFRLIARYAVIHMLSFHANAIL